MRTFIFALVAAYCFGIQIAAAELKIGYVDSKAILAKCEGLKDAQDKLNKEVAKWDQALSKRYKDIKELETLIDKQSLILSPDRKKALQDSLLTLKTQAHQEEQKIYGLKGDWESKNEELSKPIVEKINRIIEKVAKEENYDFIFDTQAGGVIFAKQVFDLTDKVLVLFNKEK
jgi:outer membrane protein